MKKFYLLVTALTLMGIYASASDYIPLLEEGKEWHYTRIFWAGITFPQLEPQLPRELKETLRIEGVRVIDGEEFRVLNAYQELSDGSPYANFTVAYLREDTEARNVRCVICEDCPDEEVLLLGNWILGYGNDLMYDFNYDEQTYMVTGEDFSYGDATELACVDGIHTGVRLIPSREDYGSFLIIEGIGLVGDDNYSCNLMYYGSPFSMMLPPIYHYPYLYEVVSGNGDLIYYDESHAPGFASITATKADSDEAVRVFNLQGVQVKECDSKGCPTDGLAPGIYLIQRDGSTTKAVVR